MTSGGIAVLLSAGLLIFLAGISDGVGTQGVALLINRISPLRFVANMLLSGVLFVLGALAWILSIWTIATSVFLRLQDPISTIGAVSAGYVPLLFSSIAILPYIGPALRWLLHLASFVLVLLLVAATYEFPLWQAFICVLLGELLLQLFRSLLNRPAARADNWLWRITTGTRERIDPTELPPVIVSYAAQRATSGQGAPDAHS